MIPKAAKIVALIGASVCAGISGCTSLALRPAPAEPKLVSLVPTKSSSRTPTQLAASSLPLQRIADTAPRTAPMRSLADFVVAQSSKGSAPPLETPKPSTLIEKELPMRTFAAPPLPQVSPLPQPAPMPLTPPLSKPLNGLLPTPKFSTPANDAPQIIPPTPREVPSLPPPESVPAPRSLPAYNPAQSAGDGGTAGWLAPYMDRIEDSANRGVDPQVPSDTEEIANLPAGFAPWWDEPVRRQSAVARTPKTIGIEQLIENALRHSSYVAVVSVEPDIRRNNIIVEEAEFDWRTFVDTVYRKTNDPVGNTLTTGNNANRFLDDTWTADAGVRRRNAAGGELRAVQRFGTQSNNSRFLLPNPQGTSRLELQYTQPLLNGSGKCVNESRIVLAQLDTNASQDEAIEKLQDHLLRVTEGYWELYRARAELFQRTKLLGAAQSTLAVLQGREAVDAVSRQILRAKAAVTSRRSEIVRAQTAIRNAESQLRLLVNSPELVNLGPHELTPAEMPLGDPLPISMKDSLHTALVNRPDISQAIQQIRSAAVRQGVADNQVLPKLDLVATTYVAGLAAQSNIVSATGKQFSDGGPGYGIGFLFEMPWGNRAAVARQEQRQLEMNRALSRFRLTVEESLTAMEVAVRESETSYRELVSRYQAMTAAENEVNYLFHRWTAIPGVDDSAAFLLENLLDAQSRLADEEGAMVRAQVGYALSIIRMKREMGVLLRATPCGGEPVRAMPNAQPNFTPTPATNAAPAELSVPAEPTASITRLPPTTNDELP